MRDAGMWRGDAPGLPHLQLAPGPGLAIFGPSELASFDKQKINTIWDLST